MHTQKPNGNLREKKRAVKYSSPDAGSRPVCLDSRPHWQAGTSERDTGIVTDSWRSHAAAAGLQGPRDGVIARPPLEVHRNSEGMASPTA